MNEKDTKRDAQTKQIESLIRDFLKYTEDRLVAEINRDIGITGRQPDRQLFNQLLDTKIEHKRKDMPKSNDPILEVINIEAALDEVAYRARKRIL